MCRKRKESLKVLLQQCYFVALNTGWFLQLRTSEATHSIKTFTADTQTESNQMTIMLEGAAV